MAFDGNDPDTKAAIKAAVAEANAAIEAKNKELIGELKEAKKGKIIDPAEVEKLESKIDQLQTDLTAANKVAKDATTAAKTATEKFTVSEETSKKLLIETSLSDALVKNNVALQHLATVKKLLASDVTLQEKDGAKFAVVGEKALEDYLKEWSATEEGKMFVAAPNNSGGGALGGKGKDGATTKMKNADWAALPSIDRAAFVNSGGEITQDT